MTDKDRDTFLTEGYKGPKKGPAKPTSVRGYKAPKNPKEGGKPPSSGSIVKPKNRS